jgi:hypothetical protein
MLWYSYLYENTMFTNKRDAALLQKGKRLRSRVGKRKGSVN